MSVFLVCLSVSVDDNFKIKLLSSFAGISARASPGPSQSHNLLELLHRHYTDILIALLKQHYTGAAEFAAICQKLQCFFDSLKDVVYLHDNCIKFLEKDRYPAIVTVLEALKSDCCCDTDTGAIELQRQEKSITLQ